MKKDIPSEFLREYEAKRASLEDALDQITSLLELRLGQLAARTGVRGRITDARVKRPAKLWRNAEKAALSVSEAFTQIEDLIGIRIVCNNLSDIEPLVEMIRTDCSILSVLETKDMVSSPSQAGYRAAHVRTELNALYAPSRTALPCEIQIRTLAQDTWARLSRADLYGKNVPDAIRKLATALSTQLSVIDEVGQLIRDELNQCPPVAEKIGDSDYVSPPRLALLYKQVFREDLFEWNLIDWVRYLDDAEAENVGEVRALLDDTEIRATLDDVSMRIRGFPLENSEWAVYSAMVASEVSPKSGIKAVRKRIKDEWDEITAIARREVLSEMPDTIARFVEKLQAGTISIEALDELGGMGRCNRCGTNILRPDQAAEAIAAYYGNPDLNVDLEVLFGGSSGIDMPEVESVDVTGVCSYCAHQILKDD